jgi:hypothetical protein
VFLDKSFTDQNGQSYTGPIFQYPIYAALGYRAFRFLRINAGATALENSSDNSIGFYPFVGVSAELNLSLSLAKE